MNGVEVLSVVDGASKAASNVILGLFVTTIICGTFGFLMVFEDDKRMQFLGNIFSSIFAVLIVVTIAVGISTGDRTKYKVTVSDEVSFNDFMEKYEIVDQEGAIYTVREREE